NSEDRKKAEFRSPKGNSFSCCGSVFGLAMCLLLGLASMSARAQNELTDSERNSGWLLFFDGKTLDGWMTSESKPSKRPVEDGCINPHRCGHYMLVHTQQWSNFV